MVNRSGPLDHKPTSEVSIFFPGSRHGYSSHIKLPEDQSVSTRYPFSQVPAQILVEHVAWAKVGTNISHWSVVSSAAIS
jgi:hypothetical protein